MAVSFPIIVIYLTIAVISPDSQVQPFFLSNFLKSAPGLSLFIAASYSKCVIITPGHWYTELYICCFLLVIESKRSLTLTTLVACDNLRVVTLLKYN